MFFFRYVTGDLKITDFKKFFENFKKIQENKNVDSNEKEKIAKNSKTAVKSCKFLAREARPKMLDLISVTSKSERKTLYKKRPSAN